MVVHAFPAAKLGALLLKQISKPIANAVKQQAKSSPVFRKYVCLPPAQFYNWCETKSKMWILAMGKPVNITVMNEEMAIELGANLLGEGVIFLIAAGILIAEYNRSSRKEAAKEEQKRREMEELQRTLTELFMQSEEQAARIREFSRKIADLESKVVTKPWAVKKDHKDVEPPDPPPREPPAFIAPFIGSSQPDRNSEEDHAHVEEGDSETKTKPSQITSNRSQICDDSNSERYHSKKPKKHAHFGLITGAIYDIENEFWRDPDTNTETTREQGVLTAALNYLYSNVYRTHMSF